MASHYYFYPILIIISSHLKAHPNNQLCAESEVAHYASFLAMLHPLHSVTNKEQYKKLVDNTKNNPYNKNTVIT